MRWQVLLSIATIAALGCASDPVIVTPSPAVNASPTPTPTRATESFAADELVLRMTIYEPIPPPVALDTDVADFSMYGDGRVIYAQRLPPDAHRVAFRQAMTTTEQFDSLLGMAADTLAGARASYGWPSEVEAQSTWFQLLGETELQVVSVWALEREVGMDGSTPPDAAARERLRTLRTTLAGFGAGPVADGAADLGSYEPAAYLATITQAPGEMPVEPDPAWPWPELPPGLFDRAPDGTLAAQVTPEQARIVLAHGSGDYFTAIAPDGVEYLVELRPLLPDEVR